MTMDPPPEAADIEKGNIAMDPTRRLCLQLFAEGGEGGASASPAAAEASAEGQWENRAKTAECQPGQAAAAKPTWEELMSDPEYNQRMRQTVQARLKSAKEAQQAMAVLAPALERLARSLNQEPGRPDYEALARAICPQESQPPEATREAAPEATRETAPEGPREAETRDAEALQAHFRSLRAQGQALKRIFPGFDLARELEDPVFARMTHPRVGIPVEDAFYARHHRQIQAAAMEAAAQTAARKLAQAVQSGSLRPREAGAGAPSLTAFPQTPQQRQALKQRIREAAARGEKIYP